MQSVASVAQVRGGRSVIRQAMGLRLVEDAKSRRFTNQDMAELNTHYGEKCTQIHIIGAFARLGVRRISTGGSLARSMYFNLRKAAQEMFIHGTFSYAVNQIPQGELNEIFERDLVSNRIEK